MKELSLVRAENGTKSKVRLWYYPEVVLLFRAAGMPRSRRHVTRILRKHERECPPFKLGYKDVRFDAVRVCELIEKLKSAEGQRLVRNICRKHGRIPREAA